ncbi:MAG: TIGR02449 family protein, partial [Gammaproteobacteria bacterium]
GNTPTTIRHRTAMNDTNSRINRLEEQVSELLELCKRLGKDNSDLRAQMQALSGERATLLEQKEQVRSQVEAMISRLRSMESA